LKVLVTCPPMLGMMYELEKDFDEKGIQVHCPDVVQTMTEDELIELVPDFDGWIIGDDPATRNVFRAGAEGNLKAAVKWGIGVDNVDFAAAGEFGIPITNTPGMFGAEVADVAMCYLVGLARELFWINDEVKKGEWPKPCGISLKNKTLGLIGYGDIGRNVAKRSLASDMKIIVYDPALKTDRSISTVECATWPERLNECDFLVFTCSLNENNYHMFGTEVLGFLKKGVRIVNVARGPLIDELALLDGLDTGIIHSVALDVMEKEPLSKESPLRIYSRSIFGSHNGSNTAEAVLATSQRAISILFDYLDIK
jgi:D-3-phosphoglycerate dehydrogenase